MSTGIVVCSQCNREVHQDDSWFHCEDGTPRCEGASSVYPSSLDAIVGAWCGCDGTEEDRRIRERMKQAAWR